MVPLCTLVQTVPISFNGWGIRESVFILYFAPGGPAARQRAGLQPGRRGPDRAAVALGRRRLDLARGIPCPRPRAARLTPDGRPRPPRLRQVRRARARASTASRGSSRGGSRATTARASTSSLCGLKRREPASRLLADAGHPRPPPRPRPLRPAHPDRPRRPGARARRAHPPRPRLRRRRLRPPGRARAPGAAPGPARALRRPAHARATRRWPTALLAPLHRPRDRGQRLDARLPGARAPRARRARARSSGTARRSTSSRRCPAERARAPRASARASPDDAARDRHHRPPQRAEGPPLPARRRGARSSPRGPTARLLIVGDGDLAAPLRAQARGARHRRPRRLRRPPHRRARRCSGAIDVFCISSTLRGHAARALRGDGRGQGHRLHRGRRLPRGARGRAPPACSCRRATPRRSPARSARVLGGPGAARGARPTRRARGVAPLRHRARACAQMEALYDEVLRGARGECRCGGLGRQRRARPGRCRATCCSAATPRS